MCTSTWMATQDWFCYKNCTWQRKYLYFGTKKNILPPQRTPLGVFWVKKVAVLGGGEFAILWGKRDLGPRRLDDCTYLVGYEFQFSGLWAFLRSQFWPYPMYAAKMNFLSTIALYTFWKFFGGQLNRPPNVPKNIYKQYDDITNFFFEFWRQNKK